MASWPSEHSTDARHSAWAMGPPEWTTHAPAMHQSSYVRKSPAMGMGNQPYGGWSMAEPPMVRTGVHAGTEMGMAQWNMHSSDASSHATTMTQDTLGPLSSGWAGSSSWMRDSMEWSPASGWTDPSAEASMTPFLGGQFHRFPTDGMQASSFVQEPLPLTVCFGDAFEDDDVSFLKPAPSPVPHQDSAAGQVRGEEKPRSALAGGGGGLNPAAADFCPQSAHRGAPRARAASSPADVRERDPDVVIQRGVQHRIQQQQQQQLQGAAAPEEEQPAVSRPSERRSRSHSGGSSHASPGFAGIVGLSAEAEALLRERRKWCKKRRQIQQLKQRAQSGEGLDAQQRSKVSSEAMVLARIDAAERRLHEMNIDPANLPVQSASERSGSTTEPLSPKPSPNLAAWSASAMSPPHAAGSDRGAMSTREHDMTFTAHAGRYPPFLSV